MLYYSASDINSMPIQLSIFLGSSAGDFPENLMQLPGFLGRVDAPIRRELAASAILWYIPTIVKLCVS